MSVMQRLKGRIHKTHDLNSPLTESINQLVIMEAQLAILERTDDRRQQVIEALDKEYGGLFDEDEKAGRDTGKASIETIVLRYMSKWGDVAGDDARANMAIEIATNTGVKLT